MWHVQCCEWRSELVDRIFVQSSLPYTVHYAVYCKVYSVLCSTWYSILLTRSSSLKKNLFFSWRPLCTIHLLVLHNSSGCICCFYFSCKIVVNHTPFGVAQLSCSVLFFLPFMCELLSFSTVCDCGDVCDCLCARPPGHICQPRVTNVTKVFFRVFEGLGGFRFFLYLWCLCSISSWFHWRLLCIIECSWSNTALRFYCIVV